MHVLSQRLLQTKFNHFRYNNNKEQLIGHLFECHWCRFPPKGRIFLSEEMNQAISSPNFVRGWPHRVLDLHVSAMCAMLAWRTNFKTWYFAAWSPTKSFVSKRRARLLTSSATLGMGLTLVFFFLKKFSLAFGFATNNAKTGGHAFCTQV